MTDRVYNFSAGPAMLPLPVMERVRDELLDFGGLGASVMEISHFSPEFKRILFETEDLLRELLAVPANYRITFCHGGGQMQFAVVPLNLMATSPARKAVLVESGLFSQRAAEEARRYGTAEVVASSVDTGFDRIPEFDPAAVDPEASYLHITANNTVMGTRWAAFPAMGDPPLVADMTSEILTRTFDFSQFGVIYAGAQKNLGTSGMAVAIVREDLLGHALPITPKLLDYGRLAEDHSLTNTINTFSVYVSWLVLQWVKAQGGVKEMEARSVRKSAAVYAVLDKHPGYYRGHARPEHRSPVNVTFRLPTPELEDRFVSEAQNQGLYALRGHRLTGGIRASLYNGMPEDGARALASFMEDFVRRNG